MIGIGVNIRPFLNKVARAAADYYNRVTADGGVSESPDCVNSGMSDLDRQNLLNNASLLLIPSGYKGGKLYAEIPTNGNGDLTWTRGSDASRTNASGLIQRVPWNLLKYSDDLTNAAWSKPVGWTVTANATTSPDGNANADLVTPTNYNNLSQSSNVVASTDYTVSVYVKKETTKFSWVSLIFSGGTSISYGYVINWSTLSISLIPVRTAATNPTFESVGNGWYRISFVCASGNNTSASLQIIPDSQAGTASIYIWGAQLVEDEFLS